MSKHPAAFINMIAEGKNFEECLQHLQETWDELMSMPKWRVACKNEARRAAQYQRRYAVASAKVLELKKENDELRNNRKQFMRKG